MKPSHRPSALPAKRPAGVRRTVSGFRGSRPAHGGRVPARPNPVLRSRACARASPRRRAMKSRRRVARSAGSVRRRPANVGWGPARRKAQAAQGGKTRVIELTVSQLADARFHWPARNQFSSAARPRHTGDRGLHAGAHRCSVIRKSAAHRNLGGEECCIRSTSPARRSALSAPRRPERTLRPRPGRRRPTRRQGAIGAVLATTLWL
jgi:hypothetical protein